MLRIAICDDENAEAWKAQAQVRAYLDERPDLGAVISIFTSADALLREAGETGGFDFYILDVLMPDVGGIDLGRRLRAEGDDGVVIYLTSSRDYAIESYDVGAFFYLTKPLDRQKFFDVMDKAAASLARRREESVAVSTPDGPRRVPLDGILYVEQADRSMRYHLADGTVVSSRVLRGPFSKAAAPLLSDERFVLCGSSYVLNLNRIKGISDGRALFSAGGSLPLPRTLQRGVRQEWTRYWLGKEAR